jgi:predicted  nucleic acid-binding Zn-ribbon protein
MMTEESDHPDPDIRYLRHDVNDMKDAITKMADCMSDFSTTMARIEEHHTDTTARIERVEQNQRDQGKDMAQVKESVLTNTMVTKAVVKIGALIASGIIGLVFYSLK